MADRHLIDEGTMAVIEKTARITVEIMLKEHKRNCPISDLATEVYGPPGTVNIGMKPRLAAVEQEVQGMKKGIERKANVWFELLKPVVASLITAMILALSVLVATHSGSFK